jgi:gamma-glutamyl-gamma-aminobutyrate hydrolase PuuD
MVLNRKDRILIVNDTNDCGMPYAPLFSPFGEVTEDKALFKLQPLTFKLMVFTGGADVSPEYYGDTSPKGVCYTNQDRDTEERTLFKFGEQRGIRMVGICRGMQFLNVMTGGKMIHDLSGHGGGNHQLMTKDVAEPFLINSFHHQMCIPHITTEILGWSHQKLSVRYIGNKDEAVDYNGPEVEAIYMPWLKAFGVQWHPECMPENSRGRNWFIHLLRDFLVQSPQIIKKMYLGMEGAALNIQNVVEGK